MSGLVALLSHCKGRRWGTVIWAGLGYGAGIAEARALDAARYVYLEPNVALRSRLSQKHAFSERETLIGKALWSSRESRLFHVLSDPLRSSLIPPVEVLKAWPNLRQVEQYEVETESVDALVAEHGVPPDVANLLLLDVRGAELEVLAAADDALLARFTHIIVHRGVYGAAEDAGWLQLLRRQGYQSQDPADSQAGGWLLLQRPQAEAVPASPVEAAQSARIQELATELEGVRAENATYVELMANRQHIEESLSASDDATSLQSQLQAENARLQEALSNLEGEAQELVAALDAEKSAAAESQQALADARQAARLSLKLQVLRENDLRELQERYQASLQLQERQHQMLVRLGERLGDASRYFHQLSEAPTSHPEDAASAQHMGDNTIIRHEADSDRSKPGTGNFREQGESRLPPKSVAPHKHAGSQAKPQATMPGARPGVGHTGEKTDS